MQVSGSDTEGRSHGRLGKREGRVFVAWFAVSEGGALAATTGRMFAGYGGKAKGW